MTSVTRWLDYFSTFSHLHQRKPAQWHTKFDKEDPIFFQIVKNPTNCLAQEKIFFQSDKILPNVVTLLDDLRLWFIYANCWLHSSCLLLLFDSSYLGRQNFFSQKKNFLRMKKRRFCSIDWRVNSGTSTRKLFFPPTLLLLNSF